MILRDWIHPDGISSFSLLDAVVFAWPIVRGWQIFREAIRNGSGLACRARFVMSHKIGKIEILAVDEQYIYTRFHRTKDPNLRGKFMIYHRNDDACWLDELQPVTN